MIISSSDSNACIHVHSRFSHAHVRMIFPRVPVDGCMLLCADCFLVCVCVCVCREALLLLYAELKHLTRSSRIAPEVIHN